MVVTKQNKDNTVITLTPNRSATWQQTKWVIVIMVCFVMIIAIAWSFVGAWVVLPFAGLEVGLFAFLMYKVSVFTYTNEVINISNNSVEIESGYKKRRHKQTFPRNSLDIYYSETENNWDLPKVAFCSNDNKRIVGEFLNLEDRKKLKTSLEDAGFTICRNKWWSNS